MAKVVANQRGYFGGILRESGDVFTVPDGAKASWWHPYGGDEPVAATEKLAKAKPGPKPKAADPAPFADPPEPVRVENEVNAATGATQPDWVSPSDDI